MVEPLKPKKICPNCFSNEGVSIVLDKIGDKYVCPKCGTKYKEIDGILRRV